MDVKVIKSRSIANNISNTVQLKESYNIIKRMSKVSIFLIKPLNNGDDLLKNSSLINSLSNNKFFLLSFFRKGKLYSKSQIKDISTKIVYSNLYKKTRKSTVYFLSILKLYFFILIQILHIYKKQIK